MKKCIALLSILAAIGITAFSCSKVEKSEYYQKKNYDSTSVTVVTDRKSITPTSETTAVKSFEDSLRDNIKNSVLNLDNFVEDMFGGDVCTHENFEECVYYHIPGKGESGVFIICDVEGNYKSVYAAEEDADKPYGFIQEISSSEKYYKVKADGIIIKKVPESALRFMIGAAEMIKNDIPLVSED